MAKKKEAKKKPAPNKGGFSPTGKPNRGITRTK